MNSPSLGSSTPPLTRPSAGRIPGLLRIGLLRGLSSLTRWADPAELRHRPLAPADARIPQTLLNLAHSIEGQREMGIPESAHASFDRLLRQVDGDWTRLRVRPESEQRIALAKAEETVVNEVTRRFGATARDRLRQLELQAQSGRALLRPEVVAFLGLTPDQSGKLDALFARTDAIATRAKATKGAPDPVLLDSWRRFRQAEGPAAERLLTPEQKTRWHEALGTILDTTKFDRIHPQAPEFPEKGRWLDDRSMRLSALRGKVVLVHFYAFQCHNCQANFGIYNRWQRTLHDKGVELVGIQTPETEAERDPSRITDAAKKSQFAFPVLLDLDHKAWDAWGNSIWPTVYVVDRRGYIRYWWLGELNWQGAQGDRFIERLVDRLLAE